MNQDRTKRKLTAILSADVVGYSRLMEADEAWTIQSLEENKKLMSSLIEEFKGRVVDSPGDNLLAEFSSVINAVECAVKVQEALNNKNKNLLEERRMHFRIGVNLGDVVEENGRIYGNGVNIAARLESLSEPGGICISHTAYDQVKSKINVDYDFLGEYQVKNINEPIKAYRIMIGDEPTDKYVPHIQSKKILKSQNLSIAILVLLVIALGTTIAILSPKLSESPQVVRLYHELPEFVEIGNIAQPFIAVSSDGNKLVYCTLKGLYLRLVNEWDARIIQDTNDRPLRPVFSPDGKWIAYWSGEDKKLKKININGGPPISLTSEVTIAGSLSWNEDNTIMYGFGDTIWRISANGGDPEQVLKMEGNGIGNPQLLPDRNSVIFTTANEGSKTVIHSLKSGENKVLLNQGASARYVKTGHIIYCVDNILYAAPFDIDTLKLTAGSVSLIDDVMSTGTNFYQYAVSESGVLIYASSMATSNNGMLVWVDRTGDEEVLAIEPKAYRQIKISPDGKKLALLIEDETRNIWIWDFIRENPTKLTFDDAGDSDPLWTVDGKRIVFSSNRNETNAVYQKEANCTGPAELLFSSEGRSFWPTSFSPDGSVLTLMTRVKGGRPMGISAFFLKKDRQLKDLLHEDYLVSQAVISPDGKWLAYQSEAEEKGEIFVSPFPDVKSGKWKISKDGGSMPLWSSDGQELFYRNDNEIIAVSIEAGETFNFGIPTPIFDGNYYPYGNHPTHISAWDIHPDDKRFLMIKPAALESMEDGMSVPLKLKIVLNWFEELKQRVPVD